MPRLSSTRPTAPRSTRAKTGRRLLTPLTRGQVAETSSTRRRTPEAPRVSAETVDARLIKGMRGAPPTTCNVQNARRLDIMPEVPRGSFFACSSITPEDRREAEAVAAEAVAEAAAAAAARAEEEVSEEEETRKETRPPPTRSSATSWKGSSTTPRVRLAPKKMRHVHACQSQCALEA